MAFYKKTFKPISDFAQQSQEYLQFLRKNFTAIPLVEKDEPGTEMFYISVEKNADLYKKYSKVYTPLYYGGFVRTMPTLTNDYFLLVNLHETITKPTVSKTHIILPQLHTLLLLTPEDFFSFVDVIASAKTSSTGDALQIDHGATGFSLDSMISIFFTKLITNYRLNVELTTNDWVPRDAFIALSALTPTPENQLNAIQYLAALTYPDTAYFPINTMIELGLDWEQSTSDYAVIPDPTNETKPKLRIYHDKIL